ncbi:hypothetical protein [Paraburkholderia domus]|uniref:hypothetical protein n=1 Tax=Paraburkholderia domus TaxID=2793075 RepID=UPI0019143DA2|nr:hypothetical protein [Paraburkholderia domus]MBK5061754.1 hypothetical protein [Burkholderia sp. R-70199]CAE6899834.1 hypothetical protein R70199_03627 [Paraburkholderia domus]
MSESTTPAQTSDDLWNKARDAGLFSTTQGTNAFDLAIDRFAAAVHAAVSPVKDDAPAFPSTNDVRFGDLVTPGHSGMTLRAYLAAHADVSEFDIDEVIFEMRSARATYTPEPASLVELADAIADLKVTLADAIIRRLARGES